jgi:uncharacterized protein (TIGR03000 family)
MKATFFSFALAAALALAGGNTAMAQRGGHGGAAHGGGGHAVAHPAAVHAAYAHGAYQHAYYHNHGYGYAPYVGLALGYALGSAGGGYGYAPAYGYSYPSYGYAAPGYYDVVPSAYAAPAYAAPASAQPVTMTVVVPKGDAEVIINDTATTSTGTERVFESPALEPGKNYKYTIRAQWMENGKRVEQKREVPVTAGQSVTVDFSKPARELVAPQEIK